MSEHNNTNRNAWAGIVLVSIGAYFLLRNFNLIPSFLPYYLFGWEMVFLIIGASMVATGRRSGFIFLFIGGISILPEIFYWPEIHLRDWWPLILIAVGGSIILKRRNEGQSRRRSDGTIDDDFIDEVSIFGGSEKSITSQNFKGGKITYVFGGSEISLLDAQLSNEENIIDMFCVFGGGTLIVPNDWTIVMESVIIFGGHADKRPLMSNVPKDPNKVLRIKGLVLFGGSEIKSI